MLQAVAACALALAAATSVAAQDDVTLTGADILNFALNLECLEAEFYKCATTGTGLSATQRGYATEAEAPETVGCAQATLTSFATTDGASAVAFGSEELATEIAADEIAHVKFLQEALKEAAIKCPKMDISAAEPQIAVPAAGNDEGSPAVPAGAFYTAAKAALAPDSDTPLDPAFDPYANDLFFLHGAFIFEDVGVTAYTGAVPAAAMLLEPEVVQAAAAILGTESYHAGIVRARLQLANRESSNPAAYELPVSGIVGAISALRDAVDGETNLDQGIVIGDPATSNLVPTKPNGLVFARTVPEVLKIVYLDPEMKAGGFFPEGINGVFGNKNSTQLDALLATMADTPDSDTADDTTGNGAVGMLAGIVAGVAALAALL